MDDKGHVYMTLHGGLLVTGEDVSTTTLKYVYMLHNSSEIHIIPRT